MNVTITVKSIKGISARSLGLKDFLDIDATIDAVCAEDIVSEVLGRMSGHEALEIIKRQFPEIFAEAAA